MKCLKALLWKDLRLFRQGAGLIALFLPLALLCLLRLGMGDSLRQAYVQPFSIAVRDEDQTVMSRTLVGQIAQVDLFSQVVKVEAETDSQLLEQGCAAVLTIPKDFFYTMYSMDNSLVEVTLNEEMPLESSLLRSMFVSIMDIISSDQAAGRAVFQTCYGDLSGEETSRMWEETSRQIVLDALGRHQVFDRVEEGNAIQADLEIRLLACALSLLALFFPLSVIKTLPHELSSGILSRCVAAGGHPVAFFLSKLLCGILLALPSLVMILLLFPQAHLWMTLMLSLGLLFLGFSFVLCVTSWAGDASCAQRWGNLLILVSLVLGGTLFPSPLLPAPARAAGALTLPYWALRGLTLLSGDSSPWSLLTELWPIWAMSAALLALSLLGIARGQARQRSVPTAAPSAPLAGPPTVRASAFPLFSLAGQKLKAMSGGAASLACLLLAALLCGWLASASLRGAPDALRIGVILPEDDSYALQLYQRLETQTGLEVLSVNAETGADLLSSCRVEGLLTIGTGYGDALAESDDLPLRFESAPGTFSGLALREMTAGQVSAQRAFLRGLLDAEARLGRPLSPDEQQILLERMEEEKMSLGPLYVIRESHGSTASSTFHSSPLGFALLSAFLTALTWAAWTGAPDVRRVETRMLSLPRGVILSYGSDLLPLVLISLAIASFVLLPARPAFQVWIVLPAYSLCVTGIALTLSRIGAAHRMDLLAPFTALLTCLAGGCFGDLGQFSPALRIVSLFTPQGLALRGASGSLSALVALTLIGLAFLFLGAPISPLRRNRGAAEYDRLT